MFITTVWTAIIWAMISMIQINFKLDKLIELNTPEYINVIPDKMIIEKHQI